MNLKNIAIISNAVLLFFIANSKTSAFTNEVITSINQNYDFAISTNEEQMTERLKYLDEVINNRVGMPILADQIANTIVEIESKINSINLDIENNESGEKCPQISEKINQSYDFLKQQYGSVLDSLRLFGKMNEEEIQERIIKFDETLTPFVFKKCGFDHKLTSIFLKNELLKLTMVKYYFVQKILDLMPTRRDLYGQVFPVVLPKKKKHRQGETFTSDIYMGNFAVDQLNESVLIINEQEYKFNEGKVNFSEIVPNKIGLRELEITYKSFNPFTKKIERTKTISYEYEITN